MKYVSLIIAVLIIELFIIIGCFHSQMEKQEQCRCGSSKEDRRYYIINLLDVFVYNCCDHDGNFAKNNVSKGEKDVSKRFIRTDKRKYSD